MAISWDESVPSDSEQFSGFPSRIKSLKTSFALAVSNSLFWPGSGGGDVSSAGSVKPGVARAIYDVQSNFSAPSSVSTGQVYITSDTSKFFGGGSTFTQFLGGPNVIENSFVSQGVYWRVSCDSAITTDKTGLFGGSTSDQTTITVTYGTAFDVAPTLDIGLWLEVSAGTNAVQSAIATPVSAGAGSVSFLLSVLSRRTTFPSAPSICTAHIMVRSTGTGHYL